MIEAPGDLWDHHAAGQWVVITTNGIVRKDGACVMGRGVALQAAQRFPDLPFVLGAAIEVDGNHVHAFRDFRVFSFPVKQHWIEPADPDLTRGSCGTRSGRCISTRSTWSGPAAATGN